MRDDLAPQNRPQSEGGWSQGVYKVKNWRKYMSTKPPIYRSGWEYSVMYFFDNNEYVDRWGSEIIEVPYCNPIDGNIHRYFVDFYLEFIDKNGKFQKWLIEVKPESKMTPPKQKRKTKTYAYQMNEYLINQAKWDAAAEFCRKKGYVFRLFTEREIRSLRCN